MNAQPNNNNNNNNKTKNPPKNPPKNNKIHKPQHNHKTRLLIDASKLEETRVAVVQSGRLEDFEVESLLRKQVKGNIYLAKVTRVEPSLQAAFVNYGGNRHGFLPFSEIHPDYYRIPVADRERLMAEQVELEKIAAQEAAKLAEEEDVKAAEEEAKENEPDAEKSKSTDDDSNEGEVADELDTDENDDVTDIDDTKNDSTKEESQSDTESSDDEDPKKNEKSNGRGRYKNRNKRGGHKYAASKSRQDRVSDDDDDMPSVEPFWKRIRRAYKIQEVIKRGQIMLIQVGKEERGNKGAAVTSYITLPGRYCVLMPNTPQSGGVSRKISNYKDRKRMREILKDLEVPNGMSVILRTAGTSRTKIEIKRDMDYLMRLWNNARELTLKSSAPALINEEGSLIKRAIRDIYHKDIEEVIVSGDKGYHAAHDMMKMLMPSHAKKVKHYKDATPLFVAQRLEQQIEKMHLPQVELKSGGYLVINPTEALISIDVNSGRATKERSIEDTALKTNIEAAVEVARQLKLRDLGGLVVIDFIDMENRRYNAKVERAIRDALSGDRARIQVGRISSFGLLEMSRQRLHPSLTETYFEPCSHCNGMGIVKTIDTMALTILRAIEQSGLEQKNRTVTVTITNDVALYLLNHHRSSITDLESRYRLSIKIEVGAIEDEAGYDLKSSSLPKVISEERSNDIDHNPVEVTKNNKNQNRKPLNQPVVPVVKEETKEAAVEKTEEKSEAKPAIKKRGRPAVKKKIEIEEITTEVIKVAEVKEVEVKTVKPKSKAKPKPAPKAKSDKVVKTEDVKSPAINDNSGVDDLDSDNENVAARDAETVNEAPKKKKKGWWNKITS